MPPSRDGIDWDRPTLGLVKDPAGNDTNIIYQGKGQYVLKEAGAAPSRRYKMVYSTADGGVQHPMVQHSPDGLRWEPAPGPYDHNRGDENLAILHDPVSRKYVGFCRPVYPRPTLVHRTERSILRMQSNDLIHWSTPTHIIDRDSLDDLDTDFEAMAPMFYENMYLGFLRVSHTAPNYMDSRLAHSRDGFHWQRVRTSLLLLARPGRQLGFEVDHGEPGAGAGRRRAPGLLHRRRPRRRTPRSGWQRCAWTVLPRSSPLRTTGTRRTTRRP